MLPRRFSATNSIDDYIWLDPDGRPTSPPQRLDKAGGPGGGQGPAPGASTRTVTLSLAEQDNLGLMIRGGMEYGLGVYVTGVDPGSVASQAQLRPGDEIVTVNGRHSMDLTHDEVVRILKYSSRLVLHLRDVGKVPHSSTTSSEKPSSTKNSSGSSSIASAASAASAASTLASMWSPKTQELVRKGSSSVKRKKTSTVTSSKASPPVERPLSPESPELAMVLEKALVLLTPHEFSNLASLLDEYKTRSISVNGFISELSPMLSHNNKSSFFTEIREIIHKEDLTNFDRLAFGFESISKYGQFNDTNGDQSFPSSSSSRAAAVWNSTLELNENNLFNEPLSASSTKSLLRPMAVGRTRASLGSSSSPVFSDTDPMFAFFPTSEAAMYLDLDDSVFSRPLRDQGSSRAHQPRNRPQPQAGFVVEDEDEEDEDDGSTTLTMRQSHFFSERPYLVRVAKRCPSLGIAIEGGANTAQALPRIIAIQPNGSAYYNGYLRVGQLIKEVDGVCLEGLPHDRAAKAIATAFAHKGRSELCLVVKDHKPTSAETRRGFMPPQQ